MDYQKTNAISVCLNIFIIIILALKRALRSDYTKYLIVRRIYRNKYIVFFILFFFILILNYTLVASLVIVLAIIVQDLHQIIALNVIIYRTH